MTKIVIRAVFRFDSEVEDWITVAKSYCTFLIGKDKRNRGYGSSSNAELKAVEKQILGRFKSVEACRQWLAKSKTILVYEKCEGYFLRVGADKDSFQKAIENAFKMTANWKNEESIVAFFENEKEAKRAIQGREGFIAGPYRLSGPYQLFL